MPGGPDRDEVHLVLVRLDAALGRRPYALWPMLGAEERARARSLVASPHGEAFVLAQAVLRVALADALGVESRLVRLGRGARGRIHLEAPADSGLHFDVAHGSKLAVIALARGRELGIDVQDVRPVPAALDLAARHFTPRDVAALAQVPRDRLDREFLQRWARRESALKALGVGLSSLLGDGPSADEPHCWPPRTWDHVDLDLGGAHVGALTAERGSGLRISWWNTKAAEGRDAPHPFMLVRAEATASAT